VKAYQILIFAYRCTAFRPFAGPGIGLCTLSTTGETLTVPPPAICTQIDKTLYVHGDLTTTITFNNIVGFNNLPDPSDIVTAQVIGIHLVREIRLIENFPRRGKPNTENIGKSAIHMFVSW
jgi:hypothetical protein